MRHRHSLPVTLVTGPGTAFVTIAAGILLAAGLFQACSEALGPLQSELNANRQKWEAQRLSDYTYRFRQLCFCPQEITAEVWIHVEGDEVVSATFVVSGEPVGQPRLVELRTVDGLFDYLQDAIDREAHTIEATFDQAMGYPTHAAIDFIENAVDEEQAFTAEELTPLQL
jgi:hypothetical protein